MRKRTAIPHSFASFRDHGGEREARLAGNGNTRLTRTFDGDSVARSFEAVTVKLVV